MISLPAADQSPNLLGFIVQQQDLIAQQQAQIVHLQERDVQQQARIEALKNEIIRLKQLNPKPNIKPNTNSPDDNDPSGLPPGFDGNADAEDPEDGDSYSRKSKVEKPDDTTRRQRSQPIRPPVSEEQNLSPDEIPEGSVCHGREPFTVQELEIKVKSVCFWLEQWLTPEGKTVSGCVHGDCMEAGVRVAQEQLPTLYAIRMHGKQCSTCQKVFPSLFQGDRSFRSAPLASLVA